MQYIYSNITVTDPQIIIGRTDDGLTTIHKCDIANVDSSDSVVDVYIETFNISETIKIHGDTESGNVDAYGDYLDKNAQFIYYKIKSVTIPVGTTLSLFTDHPCTHSSRFNFVIKSTQNVDVTVDYENHKKQTNRRGTTRTVNQY
tara:strand:+ start:145 stop:579 length:435 start_codon:yes stop_codon:yes gene_type:complete